VSSGAAAAGSPGSAAAGWAGRSADELADGSHRDPLLGRSLLTVLLDVRFEHRGWLAGMGGGGERAVRSLCAAATSPAFGIAH